VRPASAFFTVLLTLLAAASAHAHLGAISYSTVVVNDRYVDYKLQFAAHLIPSVDAQEKLTRRRLLDLEPRILGWLAETVSVSSAGRECEPKIVDTAGPDANDDLTVILSFECPVPVESLRIAFHAFDRRVAEFQNIVSLQIEGESLGYVFTAQNPVLVVGARRSEADGFKDFFKLGVEHIWTGYDHLLFLLALLLPGGPLSRLAAIVTAFTVAHSLTLALAVLDVLRLPPAPVEIAIALTIIYAASLTLRSTPADHRWRLTFFLGLIHGFGFAGVLQTAGLQKTSVAIPLLAFNAGVEAGQLVVVAAVVPALALLSRARHASLLRRAVAWSIVAAGVFWVAERTARLLS
jgi:hypothetical protein